MDQKNQNYETVFIFTPVLKDSEIKETVKSYIDFIKEKGGDIIEEDLWGLKQLAYPIQKKTSGIYMVTEYKATGELVDTLEIKCRRDTNILRFLTVRLDKYAIEYNDKKRKGLVGRNKKKPADAADTPKDEAGNNKGAAKGDGGKGKQSN